MARIKQSVHRSLHNDATSADSLQPQQTLASEKQPVYTCCCRNEDAVCRIKGCVEPLAWNIHKSEAVIQERCPLFTTIPKELRDIIYIYALTESTFNQPGQRAPQYRWKEEKPKHDRAGNLLLTCKAVYLETFLLPWLLNPIQLPVFPRSFRVLSKNLLPWQFANIQSFDITIQQVALEGDFLYDFFHGATELRPAERHKGVYVSPNVGLKDTTADSCQSCDFTLLPANVEDDRIYLRDALKAMRLPSRYEMPDSHMRLQRARPLVHLTLRLRSMDWWTWRNDPTSSNVKHHHLGLDPALGNGSVDINTRPTSTRMQELAQQRRDGSDPLLEAPLARSSAGWGHIISKLPDIKTLELILETFEEKKAQLEKVVECAKTWRFPIAGTQFELTWNGKVECISWKEPGADRNNSQSGKSHTRSTEHQVRIVRFTRQRAA